MSLITLPKGLITADNGSTDEFICGGIVNCEEDLENADLYNEFLEDNPDAESIEVNARAYSFGDGESENADDEELAYGVNVPQTEEFENAVFRLLVSKAPIEDPSEVMDSAQWLELPIGIDELHEFAEKLGADSIEDCVYYDFQSGIPQIDEDVFDSMEKIESLNIIANEYLMQSYDNRILFKAIIEAEDIGGLEEMKDVFSALNRYELCYQDENADEFFKRFLAYHAPTDFDTKWLEEVSSHDDAEKLLKTLGAKVTKLD